MGTNDPNIEYDSNKYIFGGQSFSNIFEKYYPKLILQAFNIVNDEDVAQDIASETLFKLLKKSTPFESHSHFEGFLRLTTRNTSINHIRSLVTNKKLSNIFTNLYLTNTEMLNIELDDSLLERLAIAVDALPERSQRVIKYLYIQKYSYQKISELMNTTIKNIENLRTYGLKKLKINLQDNGNRYSFNKTR